MGTDPVNSWAIMGTDPINSKKYILVRWLVVNFSDNGDNDNDNGDGPR